MQQHSQLSHETHLVLPPTASAGLMMLSTVLAAALPGPLRRAREEWEEPQAMAGDVS